jgi:hypothetical protein
MLVRLAHSGTTGRSPPIREPITSAERSSDCLFSPRMRCSLAESSSPIESDESSPSELAHLSCTSENALKTTMSVLAVVALVAATTVRADAPVGQDSRGSLVLTIRTPEPLRRFGAWQDRRHLGCSPVSSSPGHHEVGRERGVKRKRCSDSSRARAGVVPRRPVT